MWNKGNPEEEGKYIVAVRTPNGDEPYITDTIYDGEKWWLGDNWVLLGWTDLPKWEDE